MTGRSTIALRHFTRSLILTLLFCLSAVAICAQPVDLPEVPEEELQTELPQIDPSTSPAPVAMASQKFESFEQALDAIRKAFLSQEYEEVLVLAEQIRMQYHDDSKMRYYTTMAQMRLAQRDKATEAEPAFRRLSDRPPVTFEDETTTAAGLAEAAGQATAVQAQAPQVTAPMPTTVTHPAPSRPSPSLVERFKSPLLIGLVVLVVAGVGAMALLRRGKKAPAAASEPQASPATQAKSSSDDFDVFAPQDTVDPLAPAESASQEEPEMTESVAQASDGFDSLFDFGPSAQEEGQPEEDSFSPPAPAEPMASATPESEITFDFGSAEDLQAPPPPPAPVEEPQPDHELDEVMLDLPMAEMPEETQAPIRLDLSADSSSQLQSEPVAAQSDSDVISFNSDVQGMLDFIQPQAEEEDRDLHQLPSLPDEFEEAPAAPEDAPTAVMYQPLENEPQAEEKHEEAFESFDITKSSFSLDAMQQMDETREVSQAPNFGAQDDEQDLPQMDEQIISFHADETISLEPRKAPAGTETVISEPAITQADVYDELEEEADSSTQTSGTLSPQVISEDLFDREYRQGIADFETGNWGGAVHHLSVAAALRPEQADVREKLREARRHRKANE